MSQGTVAWSRAHRGVPKSRSEDLCTAHRYRPRGQCYPITHSPTQTNKASSPNLGLWNQQANLSEGTLRITCGRGPPPSSPLPITHSPVTA